MRPGSGPAGHGPAVLPAASPGRGGTACATAPQSHWAELPARTRAPGQARQVTREVLRAWRLSRLEEAAQLIVSELVSNAVRHAREPGPAVGLRLCVTGGALRIEVHDDDPRPPRPRAASPLAESGRGLLILDALASAWGAAAASRGKTVWAELALST
jgi:anti-sigma regulatory factor (Ser/Thr protein kinase)